jgi:hypothetical protein
VNEPKLYTLEEIKDAYWRTFHCAGELWFPYGQETAEARAECSEVTDDHWRDFLEHLDDPNLKG